MTRPQSDETAPADERDDNPMPGITAALAAFTAASELGITEAAIEAAMARSTWGSVHGLLAREFQGSYRGYYPKCGMHVRDEVAIAAVFDAVAELLGDPRRAARAGGRTDG